LIGLSPLPTTHPRTFQRSPVRSSTLCYERFNLVMGSSSRFGSTACDSISPYSDSLSLRLQLFSFNLATHGNSLAHAKGTLSGLIPKNQRPLTGCKHTVSDTISLPSSGYFSPFPYGTSSLSVTKTYLALDDGPPKFTQDFSCPVLLRSQIHSLVLFAYETFTLYGGPSQTLLLRTKFVTVSLRCSLMSLIL
jgi:hypothetical protein